MSGADKYFGQSEAKDTGSGFVGSLGVYFPVNSDRNALQFQVGVQNRLSLNSTATGESLAMNTLNLAGRIELNRFFLGAGYSPFDFVSKAGSGVTSLHLNPGTHSYFLEGGVIWQVIPEFQIAAAYGLEFGSSPQGSGPSPATEIGLRFRFPLFPREMGGRGSAKFDGYRYPFGLMK